MYCSGSPANRRASNDSSFAASTSSSPCAISHGSGFSAMSAMRRSTSRGLRPRRSASSRKRLRSGAIFIVVLSFHARRARNLGGRRSIAAAHTPRPFAHAQGDTLSSSSCCHSKRARGIWAGGALPPHITENSSLALTLSLDRRVVIPSCARNLGGRCTAAAHPPRPFAHAQGDTLSSSSYVNSRKRSSSARFCFNSVVLPVATIFPR